MITCRRCKLEKQEDEFHRDRSRGNGRRTLCKVCRSEAPQAATAPPPVDQPVQELSREEALRRQANVLALRELARLYPEPFHRLVARFRDELGLTKRWQQVG